ncbi:MAG: hypothetical protein WCA97_20170 [Terriglobales bacterium]|jgi:hypothetical protein
MPSARVSALTREDITAAAKRLQGSRPAKWTAIIEGRELPARPLVLEAAGVPPNDPTNSHQAVAILKDFGFDVRYQGKNVSDARAEVEPDAIEALIRSLRGRYQGSPSLVKDREREHRVEKDRPTR